MDDNFLGEFLKNKRIEKKLTLGDIHKLGFDKSLFSKFERGIRTPKAESLKKIAIILEINVLELYKIAGYFNDEDVKEYCENKEKL